MKSFYGVFDNEKYKVGYNGGTIYVYDQNEVELTRFKGLSCTYRGTFRPGTNIFVAKSTIGSLAVYDLDTLSLAKKINITRKGAQDEGFAFSTSGDLFYNIEKPILSTRTQLTVYYGSAFEKIATYFANDEKMFLEYIETHDDEVYLFGFMRGENGPFEYGFSAKYVNGETIDIRRIKSNDFPITDWTPYDKTDCRYLHIYKGWETHGFSEKTAQQYECLMQKPEPSKVSIKKIWEINE